MKTTRLAWILFLVGQFATTAAMAQQMPQDVWTLGSPNWWNYRAPSGPTNDFIPGKFQSIAIGPDSRVYLGTNGTAVSVWTTGGNSVCTFVREFGSFTQIRGIAVDSNMNTYVLDRGGTDSTFNPTLSVYDASGVLVRQFGGRGTGDFQFSDFQGFHAISVDSSNRVYVADYENDRILVYSPDGTLFTKLSNPGTQPGQFTGPIFTLVLPNQDILINPQSPNGKIFDLQGNFKANASGGSAGAITPDGLHFVLSSQAIYILDPVYTGTRFIAQTGLSLPQAFSTDLAVDQAGSVYVIAQGNPIGNGYDGVCIHRRVYAGDVPLNPRAIPQPVILRVQQRANSTLVDIDFKVTDADSPTVQVVVAAKVASGNDFDLNSRVKMTPVGNSSVLQGAQVTANVPHTFTWDASEYATSFANLEFEIMAKDERGVLGMRFITLPASEGVPALAMSSRQTRSEDQVATFFWLIGTNDPAVSFSFTGVGSDARRIVKGIGGEFDQEVLMQSDFVTERGFEFFCKRLGGRLPTAAEIARAQGGNYGFQDIGNRSIVKDTP